MMLLVMTAHVISDDRTRQKPNLRMAARIRLSRVSTPGAPPRSPSRAGWRTPAAVMAAVTAAVGPRPELGLSELGRRYASPSVTALPTVVTCHYPAGVPVARAGSTRLTAGQTGPGLPPPHASASAVMMPA